MASPTFTPNLGLILLPTGSQAGVWGQTTNGTFTFIDAATDGNLSIPLSASAYTLVTNQNAASNGHSKVIEFTGTLAQNAAINIAPTTAQKLYFIQNHTIGGFSLIVQQGSGPTYTIRAGHSAIVYANGGGPAAGVFGITSDLQTDSLLVTTALVVQGTMNLGGSFNTAQPAVFAGGVTISPSLTLNLGGDQPYDLYYRSPAGAMARLPIGAAGELLEATASGPQWAYISTGIGIGSPIAGGAAWELLFLDGAATLSQSPYFIAVPGVGLGVGMEVAPLHTLHVGGALPGECWLDSAAGSSRRLVCATAGAARVMLGLSTEAESGGSAGSNVVLQSLNDPATVANTHLAGFRATGHTTIGGYVDLGAAFGAINAGVPTAPVAVLRGASGQTGDLEQWQGPTGNVLAHIDATGTLYSAGDLHTQGGFYMSGGVAISAAGEFVSGAGVDTHGVVAAAGYAVYDISNVRHNGYNGYVAAWGSGGQLLVVNGLVTGT